MGEEKEKEGKKESAECEGKNPHDITKSPSNLKTMVRQKGEKGKTSPNIKL